MKLARRWQDSPAADAALFIATLGACTGFALLLATLAATPFVGAIFALTFIAGSCWWLAFFIRRQHLRSWGVGIEPSAGSEALGRQTTSFTLPLITVAVLSLGTAVGLAGALGGAFGSIPSLIARGVLLMSSLAGLVALGRFYSNYSSLASASAMELAETADEKDESGQHPALASSHKLSAVLAAICVLLAFSPLSPLAGLFALQIWLLGFIVLVREHRIKLWRYPKLLEFRAVCGFLTLGLLFVHFINPFGGVEICGWLASFAALTGWLVPSLSEPEPLSQPSGTLVVLEHLLDARRTGPVTNGTLLAIDRALGLRAPKDAKARVDFRGGALRGRDFSGQTLKFADFTDADLRNCRFDGCRLEGVSFSNAKLRGASFRGATMVYTVLSGADVEGCDLTLAKMFVCEVTGCALDKVTTDKALMRGLIADETTAWPAGIKPEDVCSRRKLSSRLPRFSSLNEAKS